MTMTKHIRAEIERAKSMAAGAIRRGVMRLISSTYFTQVEGFDGEFFDDVELWTQAGFSSRPGGTPEVIILKPANRGDNAIAIIANLRSKRPTDLSSGDSVVHATGNNTSEVRCKADGTVRLNVSNSKFVELGGSSEKILLGETVKTEIDDFKTAAAAAIDVAGLKAAIAGITTTGWLSTKAKTS